MRPIMYTPPTAKFDFRMEAICVRIAYMLFDRLIPSENVAFSISFDRSFARGQVSFQTMAETLGNQESNGVSTSGLMSRWKPLKQIKHKTPQQLSALKSLEKIVLDAYEHYVKAMRGGLIAYGLYQLSELDNEYIRGSGDRDDYIIGNYSNSTAAPETFDKHYLPASMILRLGIEADELPDDCPIERREDGVYRLEYFMNAAGFAKGKIIFLLPPEFFIWATVKDKLLRADDKEAANEDSIWLEPCFNVPASIALTAKEINLLRDELELPRNSFDAVADAWIETTVPGGLDATARIKTFQETVLPATADMQRAINDAPVLQRLTAAASNDTHAAEVWMGEVPVGLIWDFFRAHTTISEATDARLRRSGAENPWCKGRWPVIAIRLPGYQTIAADAREDGATETAGKPETVVSVRKSISAD